MCKEVVACIKKYIYVYSHKNFFHLVQFETCPKLVNTLLVPSFMVFHCTVVKEEHKSLHWVQPLAFS